MSHINAIAYGARYALLARLREDILGDEPITVHLRHAAHDTLQQFIAHQINCMSTSEKMEAVTEIQDVDKMVLSLEIHGDVTVEFLFEQIIAAKIKMVLAPLIAALNDQDTTENSLSAVSLDIVRRKLNLG